MATVQQTFAFLQAGDASAKDPVALTRPTELTRPKQLVQPEQLVQSQPIGQLAELGGPRNGVAELQETRDGGAGLRKTGDGGAGLRKTGDGGAGLRKTGDGGAEPAQSRCSGNDRAAVLRQLRAQVGCVSTAGDQPQATLSTGCQAIDAMLPKGGLKIAALAEWVAESDSSGAAALSLIAAAVQLRHQAGPVVIVDLDKTFYPPAAVALGIPLERIILVRPNRHAEMVWAIDQALRCEAVGAVWAQVGTRLDDRDARRFQLAAEIGHTAGYFVRPRAARGRPSFAEVRFHVGGSAASTKGGSKKEDRTFLCEAPAGPQRQKGPAPLFERSLQVTLDRCRGGVIGQNVWVQIDDRAQIHHIPSTESTRHETAAVHLASQLANPTTVQSPHRRRA